MTPGYLLQFRLDRPEEAKQLILGHFNSLTLSHDGSLIAVGGNYGLRNCGDVYVLRSDDARVIFQRDIDGAGVNALAFGPDGRTLFCALSDGTVSIYDLTGSEPVQQLSRGQYKNFARSVAVTSDARYVLVGEQMGDLCIWELDWKYNAGKPGKVGM